MKQFATALVAAMLLASPLAAQTMTVLLPAITFPDDTVTPSTKGCDATVTPSLCEAGN
ncbi:MAG: hypothetical protein HC844_02915 [Tabrizicola sp.]|nr:hypothetical protein [Tabrizicola sp.]